MRILPYRTSKNIIDGLVMTFLDITKMKKAEEVAESVRGMAASIVETVREPLLVLDEQFRVVSANQAFYRTFQLTPREVELQFLYHLCNGAWNIPKLRRLLEEILPEVGKQYSLSSDPNDRAISGSSSGGIAAFTVAFNRPDSFRRVLCFIGSFANLRGGDIYPAT